MRLTIPENGLDDKVCHQIDLGMVQEVIPPTLIEELLETYQMWEERERKTNMVVISYWLIALHLYPKLSMSGVSEKMVSGLRTTRDDVPEQTPNRSALSASRVGNWAVRSCRNSLLALQVPKGMKRQKGPSGKGCVYLPEMGRSSR